MPDWLDKAKDAAKQAAEKAKNLAESASHADYGAMLQKTKEAATHAAEEAKKAAGNIMKKEQPPTQADIVPPPDNPVAGQVQATQVQPATQATTTTPAAVAQTSTFTDATISKQQILAKITQLEKTLEEIKSLLK